MSNDAKARAWRFYVEDMLIFCDKALRYMHGVERTSFALDPMSYDATLRNLELIGEAATHVPAEVREKIVGAHFCVDRTGHNVELASTGYGFVVDDARERRQWTEDDQVLMAFLAAQNELNV